MQTSLVHLVASVCCLSLTTTQFNHQHSYHNSTMTKQVETPQQQQQSQMNLRLTLDSFHPVARNDESDGEEQEQQQQQQRQQQQEEGQQLLRQRSGGQRSSTSSSSSSSSFFAKEARFVPPFNRLPDDMYFAIARFLNAQSLARYTSVNRNTERSINPKLREVLYGRLLQLLPTQQQLEYQQLHPTQQPEAIRWLDRVALHIKVNSTLRKNNEERNAQKYFQRQHEIACQMRHTRLVAQEDTMQMYTHRNRIHNFSIYEEIVLPIKLGLLFCGFTYSLVREVDTKSLITWRTTWPLVTMSLLTAASTCHYMYGRWLRPTPTTAQLDASAAAAAFGLPGSPPFLPRSYYTRSGCFLHAIFTLFDDNPAHENEPGLRPNAWRAHVQIFAAIIGICTSLLLLAAKLAQMPGVCWFLVILPSFISLLISCLILPLQYNSVTNIDWPSGFTVKHYWTLIGLCSPLILSFVMVSVNVLGLAHIPYLISLSPLFAYDIGILHTAAHDFSWSRPLASLFWYTLCGGGFLAWHTLLQMKFDGVEWWMAQLSYGRILILILPSAALMLTILIGQRLMRWWTMYKTTSPLVLYPNRFKLPEDI